MAAIQTASRLYGRPSGRLRRAFAVALIACIAFGTAHAANNSVQGAKKDDG